MYRYLVLLVLAIIAGSVSAQSCTAGVTLVERADEWQDSGLPKRIYDIHLTNKGSCAFSGSVLATFNIPAGSSVTFAWGYDQATSSLTGVPSTAVGQTYAGAGFTLHGYGTPTVNTVTCNCGDSGINGTNDGNGPTSAPTQPTSAPPTSAPTNAPPVDSPSDLEMEVLLLTCTGAESTLAAAQLIMDSVGQSYTIVSALVQLTNPFDLTNADGSGKYYAIVSAVELACWSATQVAQLADYETGYKVKMVILYTNPYTTNGVMLSGTSGVQAGNVTWSSALLPWTTSLQPDAQVYLYDVWVYPSVISNTQIATPALYFTPTGSSTQYVVAAFNSYSDGRRHMEFYFDEATWGLFTAVIGPAWFNWVTNGIFEGARRIVFNCHTDDVFMATFMWDNTLHTEGSTTYRMTPADMQQMVTWQQDLVSRMPAGSTFVTTFPFNGETIQEHGGYDVDALYLTAVEVRDNFFWESHTWDHPDLDDLSYTTVYNEYADNNATALLLFDNDLSNPIYNSLSVITPSISGLFNAQALQAIWDLGFRNLCGDNSYPSEAPAFPWHGWYTNVTSNGFAGMYIVPRHATNIYYDASETPHVTDQYNYFYNTTWTFADVMNYEIGVNTRNLMQFRHDPFMFHQANMRSIELNGKTTSLYSNWVDEIVASVMSYTTLPFNSYTHDTLAVMLHEREARDACGFTARLRVDSTNKKITGFKASSTGTCTFPVSGAATATGTGITVETVGEEQTIWIDMTPGASVEVVLTTPVDIVF